MKNFQVSEAMKAVYRTVTSNSLSAPMIVSTIWSYINAASCKKDKIRLLQIALQSYCSNPPLPKLPITKRWIKWVNAQDKIDHTPYGLAECVWRYIEGLPKSKKDSFLMYAMHCFGGIRNVFAPSSVHFFSSFSEN